MKKVILCFAVVFTFVIYGCKTSEEQLSLEVTLSTDVFKDKDDTDLYFIITNNGFQPQYINIDYSVIVKFMNTETRGFLQEFGLVGEEFPGPVYSDSFVLLKPGKSYVYAAGPLNITRDADGVGRLEYGGNQYLLPTSQFTIVGSFLGSDYPIEDLYGRDGFKHIEPSIGLFSGYLVSGINLTYDGEHYRVIK